MVREPGVLDLRSSLIVLMMNGSLLACLLATRSPSAPRGRETNPGGATSTAQAEPIQAPAQVGARKQTTLTQCREGRRCGRWRWSQEGPSKDDLQSLWRQVNLLESLLPIGMRTRSLSD